MHDSAYTPCLFPPPLRCRARVFLRFSWGKNTVVFATCPTPGRVARLQTWLSQTVPLSAFLSPFRASVLGSVVSSLDGKKRIRFGDDASATGRGGEGAVAGGAAVGAAGGVGGTVPTKEELMAVMERFEER